MGRIVGLEFNDSDEIIVTEDVEPEAVVDAVTDTIETEPEAVETKGSK